mmetsp:Transcript_2640/g.9562  ORF Transcript_2640/g.9562 Transcript_2640/m.9562 type:complete len:142 (+) Transcript_2640:1986-2411(+)
MERRPIWTPQTDICTAVKKRLQHCGVAVPGGQVQGCQVVRTTLLVHIVACLTELKHCRQIAASCGVMHVIHTRSVSRVILLLRSEERSYQPRLPDCISAVSMRQCMATYTPAPFDLDATASRMCNTPALSLSHVQSPFPWR